jgi:putative ABC transport system permease protein
VDFPVQPSTVVWSYAVGVVVTLVASILPALRASRIPPVAALRDDVALPESTLRRRVLIGVLLVLAGAAGMVLGFRGEGSRGLLSIGVGILLVLIGIALMSPLLGQPLFSAFTALFRRSHGAVGAMAGGNVRRNPRRTGATASALMIGLTLMTMMSIFGASASASTDAAIGGSLTSQFVISNVVQVPFSPAVADQVAELDGVAGVARLRTAYPEIEGEGFQLAIAIDPSVRPGPRRSTWASATP